jgi:hypothetical protein
VIQRSDSLRLVSAAAERVHEWASTTEAQRRSRRALESLVRDGWGVAHSVHLPGPLRIDHLVAGPGGVYLLASRAWDGVVTVDHKGATITPARGPDSAWTARGSHRSLLPTASEAARALTALAGTPIPAPRPVVVVWAPFPDRVSVYGGVTYLAGEDLADWLRAQPSRAASPRLAGLLPPSLVPRPRLPHRRERAGVVESTVGGRAAGGRSLG